MDALIILALIVIIFLLVSIRSSQKENAERNHKIFLSLKKEIFDLKNQNVVVPPAKKDEPLKATDESVVQWRPYKAPEPMEKIEKINDPEERKQQEKNAEEVKSIPPQAVIREQMQGQQHESWWNKWLRNNPDLEKFIGENLINKIGISVLVLGIAFFVKYAIDQEWINETGRVCIGIASGIIMVGIAHRLRNSYRSFSSVMAGGGIAVFYFTIAFAFHEYNFFSQTTAFIIMVLITAFAVALAVLYDKIELAIIAVIGGFLAPFLVSNGSNNYVALFTYLLILNTGLLIIAYFKKWPLLHVLSFFFTLLIYGGWLMRELLNTDSYLFPHKNALFFAAAFYAIFLTTVLIHNLRTQKPFKAFDFSFMIMITGSFYAEGMLILGEWGEGIYQGIFNILLGMINLIIAWCLYKKQRGDRNLVYLLIGLTVTFISLAAPVQLHGHSITLFWTAETVLLFWLYQRSSINTFKYFSVIVLVLMLVSLMMDWSLANERNGAGLMIIFNNWQGIVTNVFAVVSLGLYASLLRKTADEDYILEIKNRRTAVLMVTLSAIILYLTFIFGVNLYFVTEKSYDVPNAYHQLITYIFIVTTVALLQRATVSHKPFATIVLPFAGFLLYLYSTEHANNLIGGFIKNEIATIHAMMHWLADVCLLYLLYQLIMTTKNNIAVLGERFAWVNSILLLMFFSVEFKLLYLSMLAGPKSIDDFTVQYLKAGITIVWALFSFVLMWLGMKYKYKTLRIISLSIFTAALVKLFLFDIRNISDGGKIAAFIMLGILLLIISFMYQRLKKIIIDDENKTV
ncbi:MAG: DUF2339 domain-containing protein [Ferruginibacter sp.]